MVDKDGAKRIVLIGNDVAYLYRFRGPLMTSFLERGFQVTGITPPGDGHFERLVAEMGVTHIPWDITRSGRNPLSEFRKISQLVAILRKVQPSILLTYTVKPVIYGMIAGAIAGVPRRIAMITGLGYAFMSGNDVARRLTSVVVRAAYSIALRFAHVAIFQNPDDLALFRSKGLLRADAETGLVNGSGVDMNEFAFSNPPTSGLTFLMVARLLRDKGIREYAGAARLVKQIVPEARFQLVGGAYANPTAIDPSELDGWVSEGVIEYLGHLRDPRSAYRDCNIFVLPSYGEGTPRTNLEAMATGRAIITTDVPGCRETVVDGVNGLLVAARDSEALAAAMLTLARDPSTVVQMGRASREMCQSRFEVGVVTKSIIDLMEPPAKARPQPSQSECAPAGS